MKKMPIFVATVAILLGTAASAQDHPDQSREAAHGAHQWARGRSLPNHYFSNQYAVGDWQKHNLRDPGDDGRWIRDEDGNYLLASIGTHLIEDIVLAGDHP